MTETFCPFPWIHFSANTDSSMRVCCNTDNGGYIHKNNGTRWHLKDITDPLTYYNSNQYNDIRKEMLQGIRPKICNKCFMLEDQGGTSVRKTLLDVYSFDDITKNTNKETGELGSSSILSIDFSWGNKCNLKCKMCAPSSSDQLLEEFRQMKLVKNVSWHDGINLNWNFKDHKSLFEKLAPTIEEVLVTGGEPLVNNEFYQFCLFLVEKGYSKKIRLKFHTNLTVTPKKFVDIWKEFATVRPNISIDAVDKLYEYIRYPGKWAIVSQNIEDLISIADTMDMVIDVHTVFTTFNVHGIPELIKYFSKFKSKKISAFPYTICVTSPHYAHAQSLPLDVKLKIETDCLEAIRYYEDQFLDDWSGEKIELLKANLKLMKEQQLDTNKFYEFVDVQDPLRGIYSRDIIPWYEQYKR